MNTEKYILKEELNFDIENIQFPELSIEEKQCIIRYIEITRNIIEIEQLFCVFRFNLKNILHYYQLNNNDRVIRNAMNDIDINDDIIINALIINFISAGKTLVESMENFIVGKAGKDSNIYSKFKNEFVSKTYDEFFSYRLLIRLRDFSQHGHLPVNVDSNNNCCFDLNEILLTPHFNHNKKLEEEMKKIKKIIYTKYSNYPRIAFTKTIADFNFCIIKIYMEFLNLIEELLMVAINELNILLDKRPDIIVQELGGLILYDIDNDSNLHAFSLQDNSIEMFKNIKKNIEKILEEEEKELVLLNDSLKQV